MIPPLWVPVAEALITALAAIAIEKLLRPRR